MKNKAAGCGWAWVFFLGVVLPLPASAMDCIQSPLVCQGLDGLAEMGHGAATLNGGEVAEGASTVVGALSGKCLIPAYCEGLDPVETGEAVLTEHVTNPNINLPNIGLPNINLSPNKSLIVSPNLNLPNEILILNPNLFLPQGPASSCPDGGDTCVPETVQPNAGHCVVCLRPGTCGVPVSQECPQPDYSRARETPNGVPTGEARIGDEPGGGGGGGSYGGREEGGSLQGSNNPMQAASSSQGQGGPGGAPALQSGSGPLIAAQAEAYSPGMAPAFIPPPPSVSASAARAEPAGRSAPGTGGAGAVPGAGFAKLGREGARAPQAQEPAVGSGSGTGDWRRRAGSALRRGDMAAAVQALLDGVDADAMGREGGAYSAAVARELLSAMGMDADAVGRVLGSRNFRRFREHFEKAMQARAKGDIGLARQELARALAELLDRQGRSAAWALVPLAALAAAAVLVFLLVRRLRRRRQAQGLAA